MIDIPLPHKLPARDGTPSKWVLADTFQKRVIVQQWKKTFFSHDAVTYVNRSLAPANETFDTLRHVPGGFAYKLAITLSLPYKVERCQHQVGVNLNNDSVQLTYDWQTNTKRTPIMLLVD